jgi:hypothetical protein
MVSAATHDVVRTRAPYAGASSAEGTRACYDAVRQAVRALGRDAGLVLIFPTGVADPRDALEQAQAAAGVAQVAGMTGTGAITAGGAIANGCSALVFAESVPVGVGVGAAPEPRAAGRAAAEGALARVDPKAGQTVLLLFVDSESGDQAEIVAGAYDVAGARIPLAGGAAGGTASAQFADGRAMAKSVVAVAIVAGAPVGVGIAHGCVPRGTPSIVTRSSGRTVLQLDGRPAETVYLEKLGLGDAQLSDSDFDAVAMVHPLAEPKLSGDVHPRYVRTRAPGGGLVCATSIEPNAAVDICDHVPEAIVTSARTAVDDAVGQLPRAAEAALLFDCAARGAQFGNPLAAREIESITSAFGAHPPCLAGVYTRGEIGRARGAKGDRNYAVVVVAFGSEA